MPDRETPPIDRGVEGPPTETENQLLKGLMELDALRARGDAAAVRQLLANHPYVQALDDARRKIMETGVLAPAVAESHLIPETAQEHELEKVHQKLVEAWNVAEDAATRARAGSAGEAEDRQVFEQALKQSLGEEYAKDIRLKWFKTVYAIVEYKGKAFVFVTSNTVDHGSPLFGKLFDCSSQPREEHYKLVRAATTRKLDTDLLGGKLTLMDLDEHEVERGKVE